MTRLTRRFFRRDAVSLARSLLGKKLVRILNDNGASRRIVGLIVETEAYLGEPDRAAHSFGGRRTTRNASMYLDAGHAYVYFTYGMHWCMNITADRVGTPTACLIRALEPLEGIDEMRRLRAVKINTERLRPIDLCSGPAKLTQALAIDRQLDGIDLTDHDQLWIERGRTIAASGIGTSPRIGIQYAGDWANRPLRFFIRGNPHVSRGKSGKAMG